MIPPHTAIMVKEGIGATLAFAFDTNCVCSGAIFSFKIVDAFNESCSYNNFLLIICILAKFNLK